MNKESEAFFDRLLLFIIFLSTIVTLPFLLVIEKYNRIPLFVQISLLLGVCGPIVIIFIRYLLQIYLNKKLTLIKEEIIYLEKNSKKVYSNEEIIISCQKIYKIFLAFMRRTLFIKFFFKNSTWEKYKNLYIQVTYFLINILKDCSNDLSVRLAEQQETLEQAKGEVKKNIAGTTELEQVSKLQRARLDKQIEQFEELQRVLVKA